MTLTINKVKKMKVGFTHAGVFHADDVFSAALLKIINPSIVIMRGYKVPDNFEGVVFDIGRGEYDHHQLDAARRDDGGKYCSFGLLWKELGPELLDEVGFSIIDSNLVRFIDANDNGESMNPLSWAISNFNPSWKNNDEDVEIMQFNIAVEKAMCILSAAITKQKDRMEAMQYVTLCSTQIMETHTIVLDKFAPWEASLVKSDFTNIIYPSKRGGFNLQMVPIELGSFETKVSVPNEWKGTDGIKAEEQCKGMTFCHASGFLAAFKTKEDAIEAAKYLK